jgi:hypothetical protein
LNQELTRLATTPYKLLMRGEWFVHVSIDAAPACRAPRRSRPRTLAGTNRNARVSIPIPYSIWQPDLSSGDAMTRALPFTKANLRRRIDAVIEAGLYVTGITPDGTVLIGALPKDVGPPLDHHQTSSVEIRL